METPKSALPFQGAEKKTTNKGWLALLAIALLSLGGLTITLAGILSAGPQTLPKPPGAQSTYLEKQGDQELAYLLVTLLKRTRQVIFGHYSRSQSDLPGMDVTYKRSLTKNGILPAAVADHIFAATVPGATGNRAWVKMVVREPRNPHNCGDDVALEMLTEMRSGAAIAERSNPGAYYYGEPIVAKDVCLRCHGDPRGTPDPSFPQFKKEGWREGEIIGAIIARVAPEGSTNP